MLLKKGHSPVLDRLRDDVLKHHPTIKIADSPDYYDISVFNECERMNYLPETLDIWADVHPSFVTLPMQWDYEIKYGIIYKKEPSKAVKEFIDIQREYIGQI